MLAEGGPSLTPLPLLVPRAPQDARTTTAEAVVAAARTVCAGLTDDQLLAALKLAYAHAGPARALSLAALARRGSAMLAATAHAALREGCAVAEKRQLLLEVLGGDSAMTLGLKGALIQLQPGPSAAATPASEPVTADSSTPETATAAAAPTEATRGTSWFRRRVQQLSAAELDGLMAEGGWLDPVMTRLRTALKASGWIVMMATAAKISPTLVEVLRRTPCPAAAPREHTVQAIARLLVSNGLARAQAHVWPLTAQRILVSWLSVCSWRALGPNGDVRKAAGRVRSTEHRVQAGNAVCVLCAHDLWPRLHSHVARPQAY